MSERDLTDVTINQTSMQIDVHRELFAVLVAYQFLTVSGDHPEVPRIKERAERIVRQWERKDAG